MKARSSGGAGIWAIHAVAAAIVMSSLASSCGLPVKSISSMERETDAKVSESLAGIADLAAKDGWKKPFAPKAYLPGSDEGLGFKIVSVKENGRVDVKAVWSAAARDRAIEAAKRSSYSAAAIPIWHCRPWLDRDSPLPSSAISWTDAELGEWLAWEWAAKRIKPRKEDSPAYSLVSFIAYRANQRIIGASKGLGSQELARWQEKVWDRRTFYATAADLRGIVAGIMQAQKDPAERAAVMRNIVGAWLKDYAARYSDRFITNLYLDFGKGDWVEPAYALGLVSDVEGWKAWDATLPASLGSIKDLEPLLASKLK